MTRYSPWSGLRSEEIEINVAQGTRPKFPDTQSQPPWRRWRESVMIQLRGVICSAWRQAPSMRPTAADVHQTMRKIYKECMTEQQAAERQ
jgi:hypothetical protein